jgi:hypothetical protein
MAGVASGIITNGLGGNASSMILGHFHLGFLDVVIEPEPPTGPGGPSGYTGVGPSTHQDVKKLYKITFRIKRKEDVWMKSYIVKERRALILIKISNLINTISTNISVAVTGIKKRIGNIGINIWKK